MLPIFLFRHRREKPPTQTGTGNRPLTDRSLTATGKKTVLKMEKFGVNQRTLLFIAGALWLSTGANIFRIGASAWQETPQGWLLKTAEATVVFLIFFLLIFRRLFKKHTFRISQKQEKNCPFSFFDFKGWGIMIFMITLGILVRKFHWLPNAFISVFYIGLATALMLTGCMFLFRYYKYNRQDLI